MPLFRKKPVVIEAKQFTGTESSRDEIFMWLDENEESCQSTPPGPDGLCSLVIPTLEGDHTASPNDWIIQGVSGEFYPCKPEIFAKTYESAE